MIIASAGFLHEARIAAVLAIVVIVSRKVDRAVAGIEGIVRAEADLRGKVTVVLVVLCDEGQVVTGLKRAKDGIASKVVIELEFIFANGTDAHFARDWIHKAVKAVAVDVLAGGAIGSFVVMMNCGVVIRKGLPERPESVKAIVIVGVPLFYWLELWWSGDWLV